MAWKDLSVWLKSAISFAFGFTLLWALLHFFGLLTLRTYVLYPTLFIEPILFLVIIPALFLWNNLLPNLIYFFIVGGIIGLLNQLMGNKKPILKIWLLTSLFIVHFLIIHTYRLIQEGGWWFVSFYRIIIPSIIIGVTLAPLIVIGIKKGFEKISPKSKKILLILGIVIILIHFLVIGVYAINKASQLSNCTPPTKIMEGQDLYLEIDQTSMMEDVITSSGIILPTQEEANKQWIIFYKENEEMLRREGYNVDLDDECLDCVPPEYEETSWSYALNQIIISNNLGGELSALKDVSVGEIVSQQKPYDLIYELDYYYKNKPESSGVFVAQHRISGRFEQNPPSTKEVVTYLGDNCLEDDTRIFILKGVRNRISADVYSKEDTKQIVSSIRKMIPYIESEEKKLEIADELRRLTS